MKIEIEITEAEIKDAIERKIRVAIADQNNAYNADIEGRVRQSGLKPWIRSLWT